MVIDYIHSHQPGFWIAIGFILLATEVLVMGFTTIVFLFAGLGALLTGLLMMMGLLPETWLAGVASFGISTGLVSVLLWRPLQRIQGKRAPRRDQSSDLIGLEFVTEQEVTLIQPGAKKYSGIEWKVEIAKDAGVETIAAGKHVTVTSVDAGIFRVKPCE